MKRPSAGMAVAFVALIAALSGTAIALPGSNTVTSGDIKNGQVKRQDIKNRAVNSVKVKNGSLLAKDFKTGELPKGDKGDPGTALAYARIVQSAGPPTVDATKSKGIETANLLDFGAGAVCISGLPFTPQNVVATLENFDLGFITAGTAPQVGGCPPDTQIRVQTWSPSPSGPNVTAPPIAELDFSILIN